jgi:hypothetical protein
MISLKILNGFIVPTCWDGVYSVYTFDECHLYEYGGGVASYETWVGLLSIHET